jgi:hypothetical protein
MSYSRTWPQVPARILPVVGVGGIPNDASCPLVRNYSRCSHWHSRARTRCRWLEWSTNFLAGCWCSTRSKILDQCQDTASRFVGRCEDNTDLIGLCCAILALPTGTDGVSSQWQRVEASPLANVPTAPPLALSIMSFGLAGTSATLIAIDAKHK